LHPPGTPARNQSQKKAQKLSLEAQRRSLNVFENKEDVEMFLDTIGQHSKGNHRICTGGPNPLPQTDLYWSFWVELLPTGQKSPDLIDAFSSLDTKGKKVLLARLFPASKGSKRPAAAAAPLKLAEVALFGHYGLSFGDAYRDYYDRTKLAKTMVCLESLLASVFQRGVDESGEGVAWMFIDPVHNKGPPNAGTVPKAEEQFATLGPLVTSLLEQGVPILVLSQLTSGYIRKMDCWTAAAKAPLPLGIPDAIGVECRQTTGGVWMMLAAHLTARETLAARGNVAAAFGAVLNAPLPMVLAQQGLRDFVAASAADAGAGVSRYLAVRGQARHRRVRALKAGAAAALLGECNVAADGLAWLEREVGAIVELYVALVGFKGNAVALILLELKTKYPDDTDGSLLLQALGDGTVQEKVDGLEIQALFAYLTSGRAKAPESIVAYDVLTAVKERSGRRLTPADLRKCLEALARYAFDCKNGRKCYEKHHAKYDAAHECTAEIREMLQTCMDAGVPWKEECDEETPLGGGVYTPSVLRATIELRAHCELIYVLTKDANPGDQTRGLATSAEGGTLPPGIVAVGTALMGLTEQEIEDGFDAAESSVSWTHTNGACTFQIAFAGLLIDEAVHRYIDVSDLPDDEGETDDEDGGADDASRDVIADLAASLLSASAAYF